MGNRIEKPIQNQQDGQQHEGEEETFTCEICYELVTLPNKFKNTNKCVHPFCTDCMVQYIQVKLKNKVSNIKCPKCNHFLDPLSCRPKIPQQLFDKWCDALCEWTVVVVDKVTCPNRDCSELILNECGDGRLKRCVCPGCKKPFCFTCKVPWHAGSSCGENVDENDEAFDVLYKANNWKRCPNCRYCVERVSGCKYIRCRCGTMFCYMCGKCGISCRHGMVDVSICVITCVSSVALVIAGVIKGYGYLSSTKFFSRAGKVSWV